MLRRLDGNIWGSSVLLTFFGLFVLDWMFTMYLLGQGAVEANPLMSSLIESSPLSALLLKLAVGASAVLFFSHQWERTWVRLAVIGVTIVYGALVGYELFCTVCW